MQQENGGDVYMGMGDGGSALTFPDVSQMMPWHEPFLLSGAATMFNRRPDSDHQLRLISQSPFGLHAELQKLTAQEIMDAKALAASKSHSEAERRRRERINNHLAKLRSLLPNTTKTDKASLLAEVIQHVKELKRQTSVIAETNPVPTEMDELIVENAKEEEEEEEEEDDEDEDGKWVIKASICCEDRADLLPELIKTLKALKLRTLRAEITTLGGRVRNVLFITGDDNEQCSIASIHEALKSVMERTNGEEAAVTTVKRQRTNVNILHHYRSF